MYAIERTRIIKKHLEEHGQAQVQALSSLLSVSEVTIRRDLERLEAEGWLTRTHGGAIYNRDEQSTPLDDLPDSSIDQEYLDDIASLAMRMIGNGDVIMLSNGAVNLTLSSMLDQRSGLTVLTNDVAIALRVSGQESNRVVLLGGELDRQEKAVFGSMALANLQKYFVNLLFIQPDGVSDQLQFSVTRQEKADLFLGAIAVAQQTIALCPAPIFGKNAFFRLGDLRIADRMVGNTEMDEGYKARVFRSGIPLFTSVSAFEGSQ